MGAAKGVLRRGVESEWPRSGFGFWVRVLGSGLWASGWALHGGGEGGAVGGFPRDLPQESREESAPAARPDAPTCCL